MSTENLPDVDREFAAPEFDNQEDAERGRQQFHEQQREKRHEAAKNLSLKEQLESKRPDETLSIEIRGVPIEFREFSAQTMAEMMAIGQQAESLDEEGEELPTEDATNTIETVGNMLADHAVDPDLQDADWWLREFTLNGLMDVVERLGEASEAKEEEVREFREE